MEIVGGGLSGLSLGIFLRRLGVPVRILEGGSYPKHKVCGEFVCGVKDEVLVEMGIDGVLGGSVRHFEMRWWMGDDLVMCDELPRVALGLSRYRMDAELADVFVRAGGELIVGDRVKVEDVEGRVWGIGKRKRRGRWIGLKIHALGAEVEGLEMHVGRRGYLGTCGVEDGRVNCCGLFRVNKSVKGSGRELLEGYLEVNGLADLLDRFRGWDVDVKSFSATAGFSLGGQERVGDFCVGDSALLIPPFTGNGMSMAIESAWLAGPWLRKWSLDEAGWGEVCGGYEADCVAYFGKRMKLSGSLHPLLFNGFGRGLLKVSAKSGFLPFQFLFNHLRTP